MTVGFASDSRPGYGPSECAWNGDSISPFCWCVIEDMRSAASHRLRSTLHASSIICVTKRNRRCRDHLDEQLETVSVRQGRDFCNPQGLVCPMRFKDCREAHRARVVECALFATPNSLKSQGAQNLKSPFSNIRAVTLKLCRRSRPT
jgi:hypothetical protein